MPARCAGGKLDQRLGRKVGDTDGDRREGGGRGVFQETRNKLPIKSVHFDGHNKLVILIYHIKKLSFQMLAN